MNKNHNIKTIFSILLIVVNGIALFYFYQNENYITFFVLCLVLVFQLFIFLDFQKKQLQSIENAMDSLLFDDYSAIISTNKNKNALYNKTAKLLKKQQRLHLEKSSEQLIFTNILESLSIGILILRKDASQKIEVFQQNDAFIEFLKIPRYYNWNLLTNKISSLTNLIDADNWQAIKEVITLNINNEEESFFLKTSVTKTFEFEYLILTLETIQQLIDKKEKESWYKLMQVMSHEIINTITPISSLAGNLGSLIKEDILDLETQTELKKGLAIINKRSEHLTHFVNSYRKLAALPTPKKEVINITKLIENTLNLFEQQFKENNIKIDFLAKEKYLIHIDKQQMEQVIINILSNGIYALKNTKNSKIIITIKTQNNRTKITFTDNGVGISEEIKTNIFVPYFTTRKDGSGIGLSLAKSIMEAHNGSISFTSTKEKTSFILNFIK